MPVPQSNVATREQFDAAAQKVAASAPAGLSREEFDALIDKEIETHIATPSAQAKPKAEDPSRWGFLRNAASDAIRTGNSVVEMGNAALENPIKVAKGIPAGIMRRVKQIGSDIDPHAAMDQLKEGRVGAAVGNILPVGEFYKRPIQAATDIYGGAQLAKLGGAMAKSGARSVGGGAAAESAAATTPPPAAGGKLVKPGQAVNRPGVLAQIEEQLGALRNDTPREPGVELPPPNYSNGASAPPQQPRVSGIGPRPAPRPHITDASGRNVAPAQSEIAERPAGPHEANAGADPADYQNIMEDDILSRLGGKQEMPTPPATDATSGFSDSMMATEPADPHMFGDMDRALASREELDTASGLHRELGANDSRYSHLTDPESSGAFTSPEAMIAKMMYQVMKDHLLEAAGRDWSPGFVGQTGRFGTAAAKKLPAFGAIANLTRPEEDR